MHTFREVAVYEYIALVYDSNFYKGMHFSISIGSGYISQLPLVKDTHLNCYWFRVYLSSAIGSCLRFLTSIGSGYVYLSDAKGSDISTANVSWHTSQLLLVLYLPTVIGSGYICQLLLVQCISPNCYWFRVYLSAAIGSGYICQLLLL